MKLELSKVVLVLLPYLRIVPAKCVRSTFEGSDTDFLVIDETRRARSLLINEDLAKLLELFRLPNTVSAAINALSKSEGIDILSVFESAYPHIRALSDKGYLIDAADAAEESEDRFDAWSREEVHGWRIQSEIQRSRETIVYQVERDGRMAALKLTYGRSRAASRLSNEAGILSALPPGIAPELLDSACFERRKYIITSWIDGVDVLSYCNQWRTVDFSRVFRVCVEIANLYTKLCESGLLHADIHPQNVLVDMGGRPYLVDFESSFAPSQRRNKVIPRRNPFFVDPEFAENTLNGTGATLYSDANEQYALAALFFLLLTGAHYLEFGVEREQFLSQVIHQPPRLLSEFKIPKTIQQIEAVLHQALSKNPLQRFTSVGFFCREFSLRCFQLRYPLTRLMARQTNGFRRIKEDAITSHNSVTDVSLHNGLAGQALYFLELAMLRGDAHLLAKADHLSCAAISNVALWTTSDANRQASLHFGSVGVYGVAALVAIQRHDLVAVKTACEKLLASLPPYWNSLGLVDGAAGALWIICKILELGSNSIDRQTSANLEKTGSWLASLLLNYPNFEGQQPWMAHGIAGQLYASLRWWKRDPAGRLNILALCEASERLADSLWGEHVKSKGFSRASWCNGSTGIVQLLSECAEITSEPHLFAHARIHARISCEDTDGTAGLCCGRAGRAFAMLRLYRSTGEINFYREAKILADDAWRSRSRLSSSSLFKGTLGIELLQAALAHGTTSMLLVE